MPTFPKKIDILIENNPYSSVASFSRSFSRSLRRKGMQTRLFFIGNGRFYKALNPILNQPPDFTFSFSDIIYQGKSIGDFWRIPHFSYFLDPIFLYLHQLQGSFSHVSCIDKKDYCFLQKCRFNNSLFLPHGVEADFFQSPAKNEDFDVTVMGSCVDYDSISRLWKEKYSPEIARKLHEAQELVLSPKGISCFEALIERGLTDNLVLMHNELVTFVRAKERIELVRTLQTLNIHIWGKGPWKKFFPKAHVYPAVSFNKALSIFQRSKLVLNSSPFFKEGAHERIFYAFAFSALPLTGENPYINEHFIDQKNILTYRHGDFQHLKEKVEFILANNSRRKEMVDEGRKITLQHHTWDQRAEDFIAYLAKVYLHSSAIP